MSSQKVLPTCWNAAFATSTKASLLKTSDPPPAAAGTLVGYARVSTHEQSLDMQIEALVRAGVDMAKIFSDKLSGVADRRPGREAALRQVRKGDTLIVWKLDRISRSVLDLLTLLQVLEKRGVGFRSLTDPIDTTTAMGKAVITILGAVAQLERDLIAQRTRAGVASAKARGVKFGQPTKLTPEARKQIDDLLRQDTPVKLIAKRLGIGEATIRRVYTRPLLDKLRAAGARRKP